jgi:hypothetical protein
MTDGGWGWGGGGGLSGVTVNWSGQERLAKMVLVYYIDRSSIVASTVPLFNPSCTVLKFSNNIRIYIYIYIYSETYKFTVPVVKSVLAIG